MGLLFVFFPSWSFAEMYTQQDTQLYETKIKLASLG